MYTVIGGKGFIGEEVVSALRCRGEDVWIPEKHEPSLFEKKLGVVIYCAGNGDCSNTPGKVFESNTAHLQEILQKGMFSRLIYLSSTRVYMGGESSSETASVFVRQTDNRRLFNLTKLVAEELCLKSAKETVVLRPSNVYGAAINSTLFLPMIVKHAITKGEINMYVPPSYEKDYVSVKDLVKAVLYFADKKCSRSGIYNVAAGYNTKASDIAKVIQGRTECKVVWHQGFEGEIFPVTDIDVITKEFEYKPRDVLDDLKDMIDVFSETLSREDSSE